MSAGPHNPKQRSLLDLETASRVTQDSAEPVGEGTLEGTLERVMYANEATHWTVAKLVLKSFDDTPSSMAGEATVVGALFGVPEGTPLRLRGTWEMNPRYGRQFRVRSYQTKVPETLMGIERYLGSGLIPGIGPELAKRVVTQFGMRTLEIIEQEPHRLEAVDGIGAARAQKIASTLRANRGVQDVMVFLQSYGVSAALAARIYKRYRQDTMALIRENPYRLALDIWGVGFKTADAIARNLGLESTAPERLQAGLIHGLGQLAEDGHVHVPEQRLLDTTAELLSVNVTLLPPALDALAGVNLVLRESLGDRGPCVSLAAMWESEHAAAERFALLVSTPMRPTKLNVEAAIDRAEQEAGLELAGAQRRAIEAAMVDKCVVITGGPGVGKTTVVRAIVSTLSAARRRFALAAPTGRAAKRLSESTGHEAVTVHRLLEYQPRTGEFMRTADNPLEVDALIVDEVSMVDVGLFRWLLQATPEQAQMILVGDVDQLPSVGPGSVLADVIESGAATVVRLTEIFRQAAQSRIVTAAHEINSGVVPELAPPAGQDAGRSDFYFIARDTPQSARDTLVELVTERIPKRFGFSPVTDVQILTPMHRGELGTIALNELLQAQLNPGGSGVLELRRGSRAFRAGDKVMQIRNDYDRAIFNGDIGLVHDVLPGDKKLVVDFQDGRTVVYEQDDLDQLIHAYAVSVHKSQGSEYPAVIVPLTTQHYMMLQRNLLYTAITRGKKLMVLVGSRKAVAMAVRNHSTTMRWTWLAERIRASLQAGDEV